MGSTTGSPLQIGDSETQHWVDVPAFEAGAYEVTRAEWSQCVKDGQCMYKGGADGTDGELPVTTTWAGAKIYVEWLNRKFPRKNYRLLSEAEWEYAARAGTTTAYPWGDAIGVGNANCSGCGSAFDQQRALVGSFPPNAFGLYDMAGNEMEWVEDCYSKAYEGVPVDGRPFTQSICAEHVARGGDYNSPPEYLRSSSRYITGLENASEVVEQGFRLARTP